MKKIKNKKKEFRRNPYRNFSKEEKEKKSEHARNHYRFRSLKGKGKKENMVEIIINRLK